MMRACGVIAEYNPFHRGHQYQLAQARAKTGADCMVVVMSGNYVQRGEPAVVDKWQRAAQALQFGADLVIELPFAISCQPADRFAQGGVALLAALGCRDLAFGTEDASFDFNDFVDKVQPQLATTQFTVDYQKTYATQWNEFLTTVLGAPVTQPNQLLALSYALANAALPRPLTLVPIQRRGADHDSNLPLTTGLTGTASKNLASGSQLRQLLKAQGAQAVQAYLPNGAAPLQGPFLDSERLWPFLHYRLNTTWPAELRNIYQMSEGLEYRFSEQNYLSTSWADFLQRVKSKRYTYARLRRLALYATLNITAAEMTVAATTPAPLRVLGFNQLGQAYLHQERAALAGRLFTKVDAHSGATTGPLGLQVRVDRFYQQLNGREQNFQRRVLITK